MTRQRFVEWIAAYERAWRSPGTAALSDLFTETATYRTAPFEPPYRGRRAIAEFWEAEREGPDEAFAMEAELIAVEGVTGVARIEVAYGVPVERRYRDIWVIRLDDELTNLRAAGTRIVSRS